jgi:hypothetical protein
MRYLFGLACVCALGVMPLVGCGDNNGGGGSGGTAGTGGMAGSGGSAGTGGMAGSGGTGGMTGQEFPCTEQGIRDAIAEGGGPHTFACDGPTTVVSEAIIVIDNDVILDGEGKLTVDGGDTLARVLSLPYLVTVELHGCTITGGEDGIYNQGTLTLVDSTVSGNSSGIRSGGTLVLMNSMVSENSATGIHNQGTMTLISSTVSGNGRGIDNQNTATLMESTVSGNSSAGIENSFNAASLTLIDSTVSGNEVGIYNPDSVMLALTNSTVSGNSGLGIHNLGTATLQQSTLSGNYTGVLNGGTTTLSQSTVSGNSYAGIDNSGTLTLTNTLVDDDCLGTTVSNGYNIESPGDTCGFANHSVTAQNLALGELADNGGPTMTHALLPGSVAIDVIPEAQCLDAEGAPLTTDQRGEPRPETGGTLCDVGAFEVQP